MAEGSEERYVSCCTCIVDAVTDLETLMLLLRSSRQADDAGRATDQDHEKNIEQPSTISPNGTVQAIARRTHIVISNPVMASCTHMLPVPTHIVSCDIGEIERKVRAERS